METKNTVLETVSKDIVLEVKKGFDPKEYFVDRKGLYVYNSFESRVLANAEKTEEGKEIKINSFKLLKSSEDKDIEDLLGENHSFTDTDVCAVIASLIDGQSKGEEGVLLNTGNWNLFYTPSCVVSVCWYGVGWDVHAWCRGDYGWHADSRVFSPAN